MERLTVVAAAALALPLAAPLSSAHAQPASAQPPSDADLMTEIETLRAKVDALEARYGNDADWLTEQRADEIRSLVQDVLADADTRASMLQDGMTAGYDNGFFLASADGNFRLNLKGVVQFRWALSYQDNDDDPSIDSTRSGFENKRTALKFGGHVVDPTWKYFVQGLFSGNGGDFFLLDGFITKELGDGWAVRAGKFRLPFAREQIVNYTHLLAVERAMVTEAFGVGRSQGVELAWKGDQFRCALAFSDDIDGIGGRTEPALAYDTEYTLTGRVDFLASGTWKQFNDQNSFPDAENGLLLGGAFVWTSSEYGTPDDELEQIRWTFDASFACSGANLSAAVFGRHTDPNGPDPDQDQYGVVVQGGYFVTDDIELFARYEWADDDSDADDLSALTVGFNKFWAGEQLRWATDVGYGFNAVSATWANPGTNWRTDSPDGDGQVVIRSQLQLLF